MYADLQRDAAGILAIWLTQTEIVRGSQQVGKAPTIDMRTRAGHGRGAVAWEVDGDAAVAGALQRLHDRRPVRRVAQEAVQEHDRRL